VSDWKQILVSPETSFRDALRTIDAGGVQIALVVDEAGRLVGTVTDGDVRRGLLRGQTLDEPVLNIANRLPTVARESDDTGTILAMMKLKHLRQIPVVDDDGVVLRLILLDDLIQDRIRDNWVLLMAGGLGTRLGALTKDRPKPLLQVGGKPILETILEEFIQQGFHRFYFSVNYMAEMVIDHFGDGGKWGVEIHYLRETEQLGTAGALRLLPEPLKEPLIVMNGDLLTKAKFNDMLDFHVEHQAYATMAVREYTFQVPYGVVQLRKHQLLGIEEKPTHEFFVSAGIYVLSPAAVANLPAGNVLNMPTLFDSYIERGLTVSAYPVREYWLDIGRLGDFERAHDEFERIFR
jgi:dTDP-glucose pyrophosphorylase/predicted transcriptional regulator